MKDVGASEVVSELSAALRAFARSDVDQAFMQKYKGSPRVMLMVRMPDMQSIEKDARKKYKHLSAETWIETLDALYASEVFEERLLAGYIISNNKVVRQSVDLARVERWIGGLEGWNEIDNTCQSTWNGDDLLARWVEWQPFLERANKSANISLRRASLVLLCNPVRKNGDERLSTQAFANIERVKSEKPILITKAVSWLLRDLVAHHRNDVIAYLDANSASLPAIAVRETRGKIETGRKG